MEDDFMFNENTIKKLIEINKEDEKVLGIIERCLESFEDYHNKIFKLELWMKLHSNSCINRDTFKEKVSELDKARTMYHNALLGNVNLLNRLAEKNNLVPVYEGVVSHDRPYRREVANAVLDYVENVIKNRV